MPVTKTKSKTKAKAKAEAQHPVDLALYIDEAGHLQAKVEEFNRTTGARLAEVLKHLKESMTLGLTPEVGATERGAEFVAELTPAQNAREIVNMEVLFGLLGRKRFLALATVPLGKLDAYLTEDELKTVLREDRTGPRRLKVSRLPEEE